MFLEGATRGRFRCPAGNAVDSEFLIELPRDPEQEPAGLGQTMVFIGRGEILPDS